MAYERPETPPNVFGAANFIAAAVLHALFFALCIVAAIPLKEKKVVVPIDLTLVVQENLDGNEDEPPPLKPPEPEPEPEPPKPEPPKPELPKPEPQKPEPPKPDPPKPPDAIVKETPPKTNETVKVEQPEPEKKPEPPKMTRAERIAQMRREAKTVEAPKPRQPNGRTGPKTLSDAEIARLLAMGYKPGRTESLAADEAQRCLSLIYRAYYDRWISPPYSPSLREMVLEVHFDSGGRVVSTRLAGSSGDAAADKSVRDAASAVKYVAGLTPAFLRENPVVNVHFEVKPQ